MKILGLNGGVVMPFENMAMFDEGENHDASATLLIDGKVVSAVEEERLSRVKHSNKFPVHAINYVLKENGVALKDLDGIAVYATREYLLNFINVIYWNDLTMKKLPTPEEMIAGLFENAYGEVVSHDKIRFVDHHMAHAASAYYMSGFEDSLVVTLDGIGGNISGRVIYAKGGDLQNIDIVDSEHSLGYFYSDFTKYMGFGMFSEYKVMGLAPYGDPSKYRDMFSTFYQLLPEGKFKIDLGKKLYGILEIGPPRRKGEAFQQWHMDIAASLQEALEKIVMHILSYHREKSGLDKLCLSGGVTHNCSANGKVMYSNLFKEVFVQPSAHDAGTSMGAAIMAYVAEKHGKVEKMSHVYLGPSVESDSELETILGNWSDFVDFEYTDNVERKAAELMANGKIIGWVQGRSEFGPRALGNRSILADPRPKENKSIINEMVKKREGYRPFAPSVIEEKAGEFFELGTTDTDFSYMTFVVKVREKYAEQLGAVTHVDRTARVQTVKKANNPKYWKLINEFGKITGVPILLNTSFNNNVEPIVDSAEDALTCFLTTGLDLLVIGNYIVSKKDASRKAFLNLTPALHIHAVAVSYHSFDSFDKTSTKYSVRFNYGEVSHEISQLTFRMLQDMDGTRSVSDLLTEYGLLTEESQLDVVFDELATLWSRRFIRVKPCVDKLALVQ